MPTSGLTFYNSFSSDANLTTPEIGDTLTVAGTSPIITTASGIKCLYCNGGGVYQNNVNYFKDYNTQATFSVWAMFDPNATNGFLPMTGGNWSGGGRAFELTSTRQSSSSPWVLWINTLNYQYPQYNYPVKWGWHHLCAVCDGNNNPKMYVDGVLYFTTPANGYIAQVKGNLGFGSNFSSNNSFGRDGYSKGWVAAARVYDRVLTEDEIYTLAHEFTIQYEITADDLTFSLYQKNETYGIIYVSPMTPVTFEIIEGSLPNTISFNTSTGQFTGKGLTDADHTYNLKVRLTAPDSTPATCNVTIYTYKTARISLSNQTFSFISNKVETKTIACTSDETVYFTIESGSLPYNMTMNAFGIFRANGDNTSAENTQVVVRATSANNQTGVTATMTLNMQMNAIICNNQTFNFYTSSGTQSKSVEYSGSLNTVSDAIFALSGTLPTGVTFDTSTGTFTSDATQATDESATVNITINSSAGTSTSTTASMTIEVHTPAQPIPTSGLVFYVPLSSAAATAETGQSLTYNGQTPTSAVISGIQCLQFNANNYITAPDTGLSFGSNNATISVWVYAPNTTSYWKGCLGYGTHTTKKCIRIALNSNQYDICGGFEFADIDSGVAATTGWHHALLVRDGDNAKLYVDGVLTATDVFEEINITSNGKIYIASQTNGNSAYLLNGYLAAARVYDRALTDDEITALAHEFDAKIPADYVFFMPMTSASDYDTNGADVEVVQNGNGATFSDVDGMHAASFASTSDYYVIQKTGGGWPANIPYGANPLAVSVWIKGNMTNNGDLGEVLSLGTTSYGMTYCFGVGYNGSNGLSVGTEMYGGGAYSHVTSGVLSMSGTFDTNWHHVYSCNWDDNGTSKGCVYIDGKFCYEGTSMTKNTSTAYAPQINGCRFFSGQNRLIRTSISALRLYNRVLTADEIALLASEFTPTVS